MARKCLQVESRRSEVYICIRVQGERYFTCKPNFGVFVRPDRVRVGDFPVEEINLDDDEEM